MICYKDMTFCTLKSCKKWDDCYRAFTEKQIQLATEWWGNKNFPVCLYSAQPECYEEKSNEGVENNDL